MFEGPHDVITHYHKQSFPGFPLDKLDMDRTPTGVHACCRRVSTLDCLDCESYNSKVSTKPGLDGSWFPPILDTNARTKEIARQLCDHYNASFHTCYEFYSISCGTLFLVLCDGSRENRRSHSALLA